MASAGIESRVEPELKGFDCTDHHPIEEWRPASDSVHFWLTLHIGVTGVDGSDLYKIAVFTTRGLAESKQDTVNLRGPDPIVLEEYSWDGVLEEVHSRLVRCVGFGFSDVQEKLRGEFEWEYEGMA